MKGTGLESLTQTSAIIDGKYYRVEDMPKCPSGGYTPDSFTVGIAYRYITDLECTSGLFPYRGVVSPSDTWGQRDTPGIYLIEKKQPKRWILRIARGCGKKAMKDYQLDNARDIVAAWLNGEYQPDQFKDLNIHETAGDAFMPPVRVGDDFLNTIMKVAIRTKEAPFEPYGKRMEALAIDRSKKIEGINIKNNNRRALNNNETLSPKKCMIYADTWQLELAVIVRDAPGAANPMFPDGTALITFPSGIPFDINPDKLIDITDMTREAIAAGTDSDQYNTNMGDKDDE